MSIEKYDVIALDCDGVILDSNQIKNDVFYDVALPYGEAVAKELLEYHKINAGISRYEKFNYFFNHILNFQDYDQELKMALNQYASLCKKRLLNSDFTAGVKTFLDETRHIPKIVVSGSDQNELNWLFKQKGIDQYFKNIFGSPKNKVELFKDYLLNKSAQNILFIGDAKYDFEVARQFNFDFFFIYEYTDFDDWASFFNKQEVSSFKNFKEVNQKLCINRGKQ
ncbi:MAG: HAD family hydrolase [Candidatus Marinamargulisbacteria bacterium]